MRFLGNLTIQWTGGLGIAQLVRQINERFQRLQNTSDEQWKDRYEAFLTFPGEMNLTAPATPPAVNTTNGTLDFSVSDEAFAQVRMPHSWREGTAVIPFVAWTKLSAANGDVNWQLEYKHYAPGAVGDAAFTAINAEAPSADTPDNDLAQEHLITPLSAIAMTTRTLGHVLLCRLSRIAASGTEYPADAQMLGLGFYYIRDARGSTFVGSK